jgi:N-acetylglucosaminyldiphosphoundecaprenol N-acetyl-beta-D-mannosaminyltransferase
MIDDAGNRSPARSRPQPVEVVGVDVDPLDTGALVDEVLGWDGPLRVGVGVNANVCNMAARSPTFRSLLASADLRYPDGQSIVWAIRLLGHGRTERVATTDLIFPLAARCAELGKRMYLFGGEPGVAHSAAERLRALEPGLEVMCSHGYRSADDMAELVDDINAFGTHVLLVGLGDPRQQEWVAQYRGHLEVPAALTCGGLFDWTSERYPRPPEWMVPLGLEWLWRLRLEPRRLASRYLIGNPAFIARLMRQLVATRWSRWRARVDCGR